jgi:hypothetical protein
MEMNVKSVLSCLLFLLTVASVAGQTITPIAAPSSLSSVLPPPGIAPANKVQAGDLVFPHFAFGAGWNTILVIVNMSPQSVTFQQSFWDQSGNPLPVTFQQIPGGGIITTSSAHGTVLPNGSLNILLFDPGPGSPLKVGWSLLTYDSINTRLGGYAIFQDIFTGGAYEALVPLSGIDDYKFYMPFDNRSGFTTTMAIVNPNTAPTTLTFTFRDTNSNVLATATGTLPPGNQNAFILANIAPEINGFAGTVYVTGSTPYLSALGFRFNVVSHGFATVPIMNWAGMFP